MRRRRFRSWLVCSVVAASVGMGGQSIPAATATSEVHLRMISSRPDLRRTIPAVLWLEPAAGTPSLPFLPHGRYTLLQKNRMFVPHVQVIPVGAVVQFPNADPFFHNVFSLFDGKRFDLGLYEAGSSKSVHFSREGVSYIFCNIHPEMSAVVIALSTPLYAISGADHSFVVRKVPAGAYTLHLWIEGVPQAVLDRWTHGVQLTAGVVDLGGVNVPSTAERTLPHLNKFGDAYESNSKSPYDQ